MAGIGFELKKLFRRKGLFASLRAYGYAGIICTGPMLLGVALQMGILLLCGWVGAERAQQDLLVCMITYTLLFSLTVTSFFSMPVTRYLQNVELAARIVEAVAAAVPVPVTVKMRKGWDRGSVNCAELAQAVEAAGAAAVCVHGRTKTMLYSGTADWDCIRAVREAVKIPVVANGDIFDAEAALRCEKRTGAELLMIGRSAFGNPWVFAQVQAALDGREVPALPPLSERMDTAMRQFELAREDKGEHIACLEARKHLAWYLRGVPYSGYYKEKISSISTVEDVQRLAAGIRRDLR